MVGDLADAGDRADDVVQLSREVLELFGLQLQTRQPGEVGDLLARDARHAAFLWVSVWSGHFGRGKALAPVDSAQSVWPNPMGPGTVAVKRFPPGPLGTATAVAK
ncbi:histidine kinase [Streptomyces sp. KO7888]|nr:histidine kinase [Streptomyces sp. OM5714]NHI06993.1 histidine kinase [Streptomyces sp. KO7888]